MDMIMVIHRPNRRGPHDAPRLCRSLFADEASANEFAWRRARAGAVILRRRCWIWECAFGSRHGVPFFRPIDLMLRVIGDPWGDHTVEMPADVQAVIDEFKPLRVLCRDNGLCPSHQEKKHETDHLPRRTLQSSS